MTDLPHTEMCKACSGTGMALDIDGCLRPCSRCKNSEFMRWADSRRPPVRDDKPDLERANGSTP